ncbi:DUF2238 domain-containing protein [Paenibacillus xylaniclasticus]|uniref:DUF2238 domain-containing protein n=1 Tax=Paenibacillus xylaniclasticus TaxID=588083 RepID=UPI000FD96393|nr:MULTISPECIES: DUF2238 domain-containing protein [Paenibacillus]GFN33467.1 membrane protein [Paenibacillus curdlanolyticus]
MSRYSGTENDRTGWSDRLRSHNIPFRKNGLLKTIIVLFAIWWIWMAIKPHEWKVWAVENVLLLAFVILLVCLYRVFPLSNLSYLLIAVFLAMHAYGGHYSYQDTPVDQWLKHTLHIKRGFYDRIVHFAFGLLMAFPVREAVLYELKLIRTRQYVVTFAFIVAASGLFELLEMWAAYLFNKKLAAKYIGLEGDPFDSQKDMTMTLFGVLIAIGLFYWIRHVQNNKKAV